MNLERAKNTLISNFLEIFASERKELREGKDKYPYFFYADTSKNTGETVVIPEKWQGQDLVSIEAQIDEYLYNHWSFYENSQMHWPHLRYVIDPKAEKIYSIVEFPVVIEAKRQLSIKQSVVEKGKMLALTYRLVTP